MNKKGFLFNKAIFLPLLLSSATVIVIASGCIPKRVPEERVMVEDPKKTGKEKVEFETVEKGFYSGIEEELFVIVSSSEEWERLWGRIYSRRRPGPDLPVINFNEKAVAAVFTGDKPTGGYSVEIENIQFDRGKIKATYILSEPSPDNMVIQAITSPFHIVSFSLPGEIKESLFEEKK